MSVERTVPALRRLGSFDVVLDVGGNVGEWAELARGLWPDARLTSFEPVPALAEANRARARGRWHVEELAASSSTGTAELRVCVNQHSASTMQEPGTVRRQAFGIRDRFEPIRVPTVRLDDWAADHPFDRGGPPGGRLLVKVDVEGHELEVVAGAAELLAGAAAVVLEVQQSPDVFAGAAPADVLDAELRAAGLYFAGVLDVLATPAGEVVQFDGLWVR